MTYAEAIKILNNTGFIAPSMTNVDEAIEMATEALNKLTPKKPNYVHADEPLCPYCQEVIEDGDVICEACHQLLDWGVEG